MEEDLQKQIEQRLAELPADVQNAIASSDMEQKLNAIGAKHRLHIDQIGRLQDETMLIMLGFADMSTFDEALAKALAVPEEEANALAAEVSDQIFVPIRESMKAFAEKKTAAPPTSPEATKGTAPLQKVEIHPAEKMLMAPTVTKAPPAPPADYKTDPYREPPVN